MPAPEEEKEIDWCRLDEEFLRELLISRHEKRTSQLEALNEMPLYPTEDVIWDENVVPTAYFSGEGCLALPKLNLQFLTLHDYLLRNFNLFRLESTCKCDCRWFRKRKTDQSSKKCINHPVLFTHK